ncbi:MAG: PepSY domain-containing protein [Tolypothrix carrinoi HA7290-LM1]|nr:PepSY domain-containing protein [Tolypothrix carrinoi HA7290-LM1]
MYAWIQTHLCRFYLDQFTGIVLRIQDGLNPTRAEVVLNSFSPLHYGTFGGLPTRILYVFVGLAPLILFITGFVMWRYRYRAKANVRDRPIEHKNASK